MKMKLTMKRLVLLPAMASILFISACDNEKISDDVFYECIAKCMAYCYQDICNQNIAGQPLGTHNLTVTGPMGGTVVITGSNSSSGDIVTENLVLDLTNVKYIWFDTQITMTGTTTCTGTHSDSYESLNYNSSNMHIVGVVDKDGDVREMDKTGVVIYNSGTGHHSGEIYGHSVSW